MKEVLNDIVKKLVKKDKNILSIFMQGSSIYLGLDDYSDIDLTILYNKKPKRNFYVEKRKVKRKNILISYSYREYKHPLDTSLFSLEDLATNLISLKNSKVLYDKKNYYKKFKNSFKKSHLIKKQKTTFPFYFNVLVDTYYKIQRLYKRKDYQSLMLSRRTVADKSLKLITCFNEIKLNKNLYNNPRGLRKTPKNYKKYFYLVRGAESPKDVDELYHTCRKLVKETILFINKQDLSKIKDKQFHELLNGIVKEFG